MINLALELVSGAPLPFLQHVNLPEAERHLTMEKESSLGKGGQATLALPLGRAGSGSEPRQGANIEGMELEFPSGAV